MFVRHGWCRQVARDVSICEHLTECRQFDRQTVFIAGSKLELGCNCDLSFLSPTLVDLYEANTGRGFHLTVKLN